MVQQKTSPLIGVLALQGDFLEHRRALEGCGAQVLEVRTPQDLEAVRGLVIPGGESTTIGKLLQWTGLEEALRHRIQQGMPVYGTCAGAILLAKTIAGREKAPQLGIMDIAVERNAYGRQLDSFEQSLTVHFNGIPHVVSAVFIRAPKITAVGPSVEVLSTLNDTIVMARENHILVSTFHPELTPELAIHRYFVEQMVSAS
jgi:5'-phosphate synthase pdxT subunit